MARFRGGKKSRSGKRKALYNSVKGRQNAKRKPLLSGRGITQKSYETGFFDFLNVFWSNNLEMELWSLTKQVANAWDTLLPKPKHSKRTVLKDYSKEYKMLQEEAKKQKNEQEQNEKIKKYESEQNIGTGTEASGRSNFDDSEESIQSKGDIDDDRSKSDIDEKLSQTDESISENRSEEDSGSKYESDDNTDRRGTRTKRKRNGRKYESYEEYLNAHGKKIKQDTDDAERTEGNGNDQTKSEENKNSKTDQNREENKSPEEGIFFPIRETTSFDRIVRTEFEDQNEMLRKLKLYGSNTDPNVPDDDDDDPKEVRSDGSFSLPLAGPKLSPNSGNTIPCTAKLTSPTDTLHVKNLVVGIRQPELQDIFQIFLNDINLIRVLDNEFNGEAAIEFKTVEAAENVWRQMNGVEYKRLPLVLEFANKEDLFN